MEIKTTGFNGHDFDEAQRIAALVNFDVMVYARKLRSCGPGCDYFSKDKKYFITMLIKHINYLIENSSSGESLLPDVHLWYENAKTVQQEYQAMETRFMRARLGREKDESFKTNK